jgi:hypothetical protein
MNERPERPSGLVSTKEFFEYLQKLAELSPEEMAREIEKMTDEQAEQLQKLLPLIQNLLDERKE